MCTCDSSIEQGVYELLLAAALIHKAHKGVQRILLEGQPRVQEGRLHGSLGRHMMITWGPRTLLVKLTSPGAEVCLSQEI